MNTNAGRSLMKQLESAKEEAGMREFEVTITETLKKTVTVKAKDRVEAEEAVSDDWRNSVHILDADDFFGVEFEAKPHTRAQTRTGKGEISI